MSGDIVFRWNLWNIDIEKTTLLHYSIFSFKKYFGNNARYLVFTDEKRKLERCLEGFIEIHEFSDFSSEFNIKSETPWKKWIPNCKYEVNSIEFHVDIDIFLLNEPSEIYEFIDSNNSYLCLLENYKETWPYGNFADILPQLFPTINAGFFGQNKNSDLSMELLKMFNYWKEILTFTKEKYHDEQGALLQALLNVDKKEKLQLLPTSKYRNVSPFDPPIENISDLCLLHATCDGHPGFVEYFSYIAKP